MGEIFKRYGLTNMSEYEKDKLQETALQMSRIVEMINRHIRIMDYCDEEDIYITEKEHFHKIRSEQGLAGPNSDINKIEKRLEIAQIKVLQSMSERQLRKMENDLGFKIRMEDFNKELKISDPKQSKGYNE